MSAASSRDSDFISEARDKVRAFWEALHGLLNMQNQWNALDYTNTLTLPADATDTNFGLTRAEVSAVVFDTANEAKLRLIDTGHKTNLAKLL